LFIRSFVSRLPQPISKLEQLFNQLFRQKDLDGSLQFSGEDQILLLIWGSMMMTVTGFVLYFKEEWLMFFQVWTYDAVRTNKRKRESLFS